MNAKTIKAAMTASCAVLVAGGLSSCGAVGGSSGADEEAICSQFPSEEISVVVPFDPGGGFDAWARLFVPYLQDKLGDGASVRVENVPGAGGMKGVNTVYSAEPDGTTLLFIDPGSVIVNQVVGDVADDFDVNNFEYVGALTQDPDIFYVGADSGIDSLEELRGTPVKHSNQQAQANEIILYEEFDVDASYILHEGTSDVVLSVRRGDMDASRGSLSSLYSYIESGEIKPIAHLGLGEIGPEHPGSESLQGLDNLESLGLEDLAAAFDYRRVLAAPPETPSCVTEALEQALQETLEDEEFVSSAEDASLVVVPAGAAETEEIVKNSTEAIDDYADVISRGLNGN